MMMINRPIKTKEEHKDCLSELKQLLSLGAQRSEPERERSDLLMLLIQDYEQRNFPLELPNPIEAIRFRMEQAGLSQRDLAPYIGSPSKVSEVLSGKRPLSLRMIRALHHGLGIPLKVLLQEAPPEPEPSGVR